MKVRILQEAERDIEEAFGFFESRDTGWVLIFLMPFWQILIHYHGTEGYTVRCLGITDSSQNDFHFLFITKLQMML